MDSPAARVSTSFPSTVTRTVTAFRCRCAIVSRTILITASALAVSGDAVGGGISGPAQPTSSADSRRRRHRAPERGSSVRAMTEVWLLGGYQTDFARNFTREGLDFADLTD